MDCLSLCWLAGGLQEAIAHLKDAAVHFEDALRSINAAPESAEVVCPARVSSSLVWPIGPAILVNPGLRTPSSDRLGDALSEPSQFRWLSFKAWQWFIVPFCAGSIGAQIEPNIHHKAAHTDQTPTASV